jgi:hypothetical protein
MKTLIALAAVAALTGCAVAPAPAYYAAAPVTDPYQWHTVSVNGAPVSNGSTVTYAEPAYTTTAVTPVYAPAPVYYAPAPAYYYPPVSIGLDFVWGNWCCGHRYGGRGYYRHR